MTYKEPVLFASRAAEELAAEAGLGHADFVGVAFSGKAGGYTTADVRAMLEARADKEKKMQKQDYEDKMEHADAQDDKGEDDEDGEYEDDEEEEVEWDDEDEE
jgi:hypothetical protein